MHGLTKMDFIHLHSLILTFTPLKMSSNRRHVQGLRLTVSLREGVPGNHHCCNGGKGLSRQVEIHLMQASREAKGDFEEASPASPMVTWHERSVP